MNYYKPLKEQLAGFYQFGSEYYVIEDENDYRAELTAIHERTHANLGVATSFGIFQQILFRINSELKDSHEKYFANMFFEFSLNNVINCHESAATFHEFSCAKHDKFSGIELMELELPVEYKKWKQIYSDLFNNCTEFEPYAQGVLGYHISRKCMDTNILKDIKHFQTLEAGEEYFRSNLNSPDRRQEIVCNCLSQKKELGKTFKKFLEYYKEIKEELHSNYKNPDIGSRQTTYRFQSKMTRIIDKILIVEFRTAGLPIYDFRKANFIDSANTLIDYCRIIQIGYHCSLQTKKKRKQ